MWGMFDKAVLPLAILGLYAAAVCGVGVQVAIVAVSANYAIAMVFA